MLSKNCPPRGLSVGVGRRLAYASFDLNMLISLIVLKKSTVCLSYSPGIVQFVAIWCHRTVALAPEESS